MQAQQPSAALGQVLASSERGAAAVGSAPAAGPATEGTSGGGLPAAIALPSALALPALGLPEGLPVGSTPQNILALLQEHAGARALLSCPGFLECLLACQLPQRLCPICPRHNARAFVFEYLKRAKVRCNESGVVWQAVGLWPLPLPSDCCVVVLLKLCISLSGIIVPK